MKKIPLQILCIMTTLISYIINETNTKNIQNQGLLIKKM